MPTTEPFRSLAEVQVAKARLRAERDRTQDALRVHVDHLREPHFRRALMGDAVGDVLQAWRPLKTLSRLLGGPSGMTGKALGLALGAKARTPWGRAAVLLASALLPGLVERLTQDPQGTGQRVLHELGVSWQRIKDHLNARRQAHTEHTEE
jgi:hypothetical protein